MSRRDIQVHRDLPDTPLSQQESGGFLGNPSLQAFLVLVFAIGAVVFYISNNQEPDQSVALPVAVVPTNTTDPEWRIALESQVDSYVTVTPTVYIPPSPTPTRFIPEGSPQVIDVGDVQGTQLPTLTPGPTGLATVPFRGATPVPSPTGFAVEVADSGSAIEGFQPPSEDIPLSLQPNDHFYFQRPVDATANGESLFYYPYGSSGEVFRIHHGIDIPNPVGERVIAAANGEVIWSGRSYEDIKEGVFEVYASYGEVIVIEHDFSFKGQRVYTLYAHLSERFVEAGQKVTMGDTIGLVGDTGYVTGAHVHFEVRVGVNSYWNTRNPLLWIAPYVNHGVVAGRLVNFEGEYIQNALVQINRSGRRFDSTTTYQRPFQEGALYFPHVVPDDNWEENFVLSDVPSGTYQLVIVSQGQRITQQIEVRPGLVNFFEFQIEADSDINLPDDTPTPLPTAAE